MSNHQASNKENLGSRDRLNVRRAKRRSIRTVLNHLDISKDIQNKRKKTMGKATQKEKMPSRNIKKSKKKSKVEVSVQKLQTVPLRSITLVNKESASNDNQLSELDLYTCQTMRDQEDEDFPEKFLGEINRVLSYKMKTKKFQYTKRITEQSKLMRDIKNVITSFQRRTAHFTESCLNIEEQLIAEKKQCESDLISVKEVGETVRTELKESKAQLIQYQENRRALQLDKEKLQIVREHSNDQLKQLKDKNQELEPKITKMTAILEKSNKKLSFGDSKFEKLKEQVVHKTNQCSKIQIEHKEELICQQKEFDMKVNAEQDKLNEAKSELESLLREKKSIEIKLQEEQIQTAVLKSEHSRSLEKSEALHREKVRLQEESLDIKQKIETKNKELTSVVSSFNRTQSFNEERTNTLSGEKKKMEEKLGLLVTEKEIADEKNQHLNKTLTKVKESHNHCSKQYDNTCMQLQESEQELKLLKTDFSESIEKLKNEHKQSQTCWEEKKVELCQTIKKKDDTLKNITGRIAKFSKELNTFKEKCNVTDNQQLEEFCRLAMEANFLRKQLSGNENVAKTLADLQAENKELKKKMVDSEMMCNKLHVKLQKLKGKRKS